MYSQSNSFLGGGSSLRPGPQQFGGSFGQQPGQQQPSPFGPQPTGFGQQPALQQQYTGYLGLQQPQQAPGQLQAQYTGFPGPAGAPQQQSFQTGAPPPIPAIPQQFQAQFQQQQQQQQQQPSQFSSPLPQAPPQPQPAAVSPTPPMKPQPTGFSQMAASFQTGGGAKQPARSTATKSSRKIPNIRLSFITASDQSKFETLFKSAVGEEETTMSGEKARDLLLRSRLDGDSLSHIWTLADTTRSGQLHFPEFALAMYLCNLKMTGRNLPPSLPETIKNEVSSMVDIINFNVAEEAAGGSAPATNAPSFTRTNTATPPVIQAPQPQPSNSALLQSQMTGFPGQQAGFLGQSQGLQTQPTGFPLGPAGPQATGYTGPRPPMPPMPTGYGSGLSPAGPGGMMAPLNAQPTGRPGQWGLVNAPASGLPNIDALQARMMPQQGREQQSYTTTGLQGNAVIPWAITKEEKTRYDSLFRAWDGLNKGYIGGDQAIEIFGQSGLAKPDLERIWTLSDNGNKGRLNLDEFAVAMHLIYRKLNGYPIPNQLPPELVPPSTRNLNESIGTIKSMLHQESDFRKNSGAALLPQKTGVSYLKNHSFRGTGGGFGGARKDATVFKNNDDAVGYRSSARHRMGNHSPRPDSPASSASNDDLTLDQLRKKIREKQVLLDAMDFKDEKNAEEDDVLDRRDRREAEELYRRIRRVQEDTDAHPNATLSSGDSEAERRALKRQLQNLTDKIPELASQVRRTEKAIADARLELFRLKDAKAHPGSASHIIGTGPGGSITESDRLKARAKAMMQQRTAALTGRKIETGNDDLDAPKRLEEEKLKITTEKENNERMVRDVEDSVRDFSRGIEDSLKDGAPSSTNEHERRRWEDALGVEDEVRDFIFDLQRESRSARIRNQDRRGERPVPTPSEPVRPAEVASPAARESPAPTSRTATPTTGGSYSAYKTPEERAAFIRQQAEQRMAERLAALGIKAPTKPGETAAQRIERERAERAAKLRQAEEEDARRDAERQARIDEEMGVPTVGSPKAKPPPAPPSRKGAKADDSAKRAEEDAAQKAEAERLERERQEQQAQTQQLEANAKQEEDELVKEREAADARLKALEEQVRQGKLRKEEEKRRKKAALAEAKEKEAKLASRRAEIDAARKREEELQRQLAAMNEDESSSDEDDGPQQITPQASTPTVASQELEPKTTPPAAPPMTVVTSPPAAAAESTESRNPYYRMLSHSSDSSPSPAAAAPPPPPPPAAAPPVPGPAVPAAPPPPAESTNPFFRMTQEAKPSAPAAAPVAPGPTQHISRKRADSDDWGSDNDDDNDDSDDDDRPGGGSAAALASILFGTMGPPRPLSAMDNKSASPSVASPVAPPPPAPPAPETSASTAPAAPPPPPPPMPTASPAGAPPAPPPPPPPPGAGAPGAPPPPPPGGAPPPPPPPPGPGDLPAPPAGGAGGGGRPAGFLGEIQAGKALRKTVTKDKSGAAVAGRVLG